MEDRKALLDHSQHMPIAELMLGVWEDMGECINLTTIFIRMCDPGAYFPFIAKVSEP